MALTIIAVSLYALMAVRKTSKNYESVTAVITSSRHYNLLEDTIQTFIATNSYPLLAFVVVEDGLYHSGIQPVMDRYPNITWLFTGGQKGQLKALDMAYSLVETEWIFHSADDWLFLRPGFIEFSLSFLWQNEDVGRAYL